MNPVFTSRRRAEEFHSSVEDPSSGALDDAPYADLLAAVALLRSVPAPVARPEFVEDLRARLMVAAETALVADTHDRLALRRAPAADRRTRSERRLAVAVGGFAMIAASGSMAVAAQSALPGDTLYPLKRAIENVHESLVRDADAKGATMLDNATDRLDEVGALSREQRDPAVITETLEEFTRQADQASQVLLDDYAATGDEAAVEELRGFTTTSMATLEELQGTVPPDAQGALSAAAAAIAELDRLAVQVCPSCGVLPLVEDTVQAVGALSPIFEELLADPVGTILPGLTTPPRDPDGDQQPGQQGQQGQGQPGQQGGAVDPAAPGPGPGPGTPAPTQQPAVPVPGASSTPTVPGSGGGGGPRGPLTPLTDPLDDLIEGLVGGSGGSSGGGSGGSGSGGTSGGGAGGGTGTGSGDGLVGDLLTGTADALDGLLGGGQP
ncbi:hypothetical protein FE634_03550 [Nocardioides dongxiaopingii]|uniref:DUF5667 domain-containing protein n=1 Tax=Nocardioides sp. S-1144 TaxID=2582905 RepID=UPI00110E32F7|nr:DUF5667 domain-containing protein [Nocardioides sp. S-1144]QCW49711.1 hypothetical protein FE634_03550 [Nocardioides sp. S-1144]